jgi:hypothetical protein
MKIDQQIVDQRVARPTEALNLEVKNWIDPNSVEGQAKIVKAALALRNRNGGELVIGFNDKTLLPEVNAPLPEVRSMFRLDPIQALVTKFASEPFEVCVGFSTRDGQDHPVILIPAGVQIPVAAKSDLVVNGKKLIKAGAVYFRSLRSNGTVSSTEARPEDWRDIMEICFNNREADFGAFFRRQLAGSTPESLRTLLGPFLESVTPKGPTPCERAKSWAEDCRKRLEQAIAKRRKEEPDQEFGFLNFGTWEVALVICGKEPEPVKSADFLNTVSQSNPNYTGWPVWLDSRSFPEQKHRPYVRGGAYESLIISYLTGFSNHIDFIVMEPGGRFYLWRTLQDDTTPGKVEPGKAFDPWLAIYRQTEALAVGLAYAKALGYDPTTTTLAFHSTWTRLKGRSLAGWADTQTAFFSGAHLGGSKAVDDEISTCVEIPLETPASALAPFVRSAMHDVLFAFNGFEFSAQEIEGIVSRLLKRQG